MPTKYRIFALKDSMCRQLIPRAQAKRAIRRAIRENELQIWATVGDPENVDWVITWVSNLIKYRPALIKR